jgi:hypothetical protein
MIYASCRIWSLIENGSRQSIAVFVIIAAPLLALSIIALCYSFYRDAKKSMKIADHTVSKPKVSDGQ